MRRLGFAAVIALTATLGGYSFAFALDAPSSPSGAKSRVEKSGAPAAKAKRKAKSSRATKSARPPIAHSFAPDIVKRHHAIQHPKLAAPLSHTDVGMKWSAGNDRARDVRAQTIMNRTPATGGKVGLKLPF